MPRNWPRSFPGHARSIFPAATTCLRWATRSSKPLLSISLINAHELCAGRWSVLWRCFALFVTFWHTWRLRKCDKRPMWGSRDARSTSFMAQYQTRPARALDKVDPVWARIRSEAEDVARREPELATFIYENILHHDTLEAAIAHRVSQRLDHADVSADLIRQAYHDALEDEPSLGEAFRADIVATVDRDPATSRFIEP